MMAREYLFTMPITLCSISGMFYRRNRSGYREVFYKKLAFKNFANFTGKHLYLKKDWHRCLLMNFAKFTRTPFFQSTSNGYF